MSIRNPQVQAIYEAERAKWPEGYCPFCDVENVKKDLVKEYISFWVINNRYPYADSKYHYVILPKRHTASLADMDVMETAEWIKAQLVLIEQHHSEPLDILTRGVNNSGLSVKNHVHTHLIVR